MIRNGGGSITLESREVWVVDQQCMILHQGFCADWVGYMAGDKFENNSDESKTFDIDYGSPPCVMCNEHHLPGPNGEPCLTCTCWTTNGDVGCDLHDPSKKDAELHEALRAEAWFGIGPDDA